MKGIFKNVSLFIIGAFFIVLVGASLDNFDAKIKVQNVPDLDSLPTGYYLNAYSTSDRLLKEISIDNILGSAVVDNLFATNVPIYNNFKTGVDSFWTTLTSDSIRIPGLTATSTVIIQEWTPNYSATADTSIYTVQCKTDTAFIFRYGTLPGSVFKSGSQYKYMYKL